MGENGWNQIEFAGNGRNLWEIGIKWKSKEIERNYGKINVKWLKMGRIG